VKRPDFPNRCPVRQWKPKMGAILIEETDPAKLCHETLMVPPPILHRLPLEVVDVDADGIFRVPAIPEALPPELSAWMLNGYVYPDDEGGEFWIITSICGHCGGSFTITKDHEP